MRGAWLLLAVAGMLGPLVANAGTGEYAPVEVDASELTYFSDGKGHYLAARLEKGKELLFYARGDGSFLRQRAGSYVDRPERKELDFWSPQSGAEQSRSRNFAERMEVRNGFLGFRDGKWFVRCGVRDTPVFQVSEADARRLGKRKLEPRLHRRRPYFIGRDDRGYYYYVDELEHELGRGDLRFFRGRTGAMRQERLTTLIVDNVGEVFQAASGRLVRNRLKKESYWAPNKGEREEVFGLDLVETDFLIYNSLGIYRGRLGTPCDDL